MAESEKRKNEKKPGGRKKAPRPGKNSEGTNRKDGPPGAGGGLPQLSAGLDGPPGAGGPDMGAPPTAMEPPPTPSPPVPPGMLGGPPGMSPPPPGGGMPVAPGAPMPGMGAQPGTVPPQATGAAPPTLGAGFPDQLQAMPQDQNAVLQQQMQTGFGPGASDADFDLAMNATAQVRALEAQAVQRAFSQNEEEMEVAELGRLMGAILRRRAASEASAPRSGLPL